MQEVVSDSESNLMGQLICGITWTKPAVFNSSNEIGQEVKLANSQAQYFTEYLGDGVNLEMIAIPDGKFLMGTDDEEIERLVKQFDWESFRAEKPLVNTSPIPAPRPFGREWGLT